MKLTYITNSRMPNRRADSQQVAWMCSAFEKQGYEVELFCPLKFKANEKPYMKFMEDDYKTKISYKIKRFIVLDNVLVPKLTGCMGKYIVFLLQLFLFFIFLLPYLIFHKTDIYYCRYPLAAFILGLLRYLSIVKNKIVIASVHEFPKDNLSKILYSWALQRIDGVVVNSRYLKGLYCHLGIPSENIFVAHNGVDLGRFTNPISKNEARGKLNMPQGANVIVYVGDFSLWKGVSSIIESSSFLSPESLLFLIGGQDNGSLLAKDLVKKFNLDNVVIEGYVGPNIVQLYLTAADIVVLPNSAKDERSYYTSPLKLFEYMASRRPIVASDLPSIKEILEDEKNAVLVEPDSPKAFADGINKLLKDKGLAERISTQAYQQVQQYTWERRAQKIKEFMGGL